MSELQDFLRFRKMIVPTIIEILFWLGVLGCVIACLVNAANGMPLQAIFVLILGPLVVRIYCELLIVAFKILEVLVDIRDKNQPTPPVM